LIHQSFDCTGVSARALLVTLCASLGAGLSSAVSAQEAGASTQAAPTRQITPIVVTGTRLPQDPQQLPFAIDVVDSEQIRAENLQVNLSESLQRVPGINVQNRGNYAQDLQISSRGFGGRASFGVRGIRLFTDGIPASQPDGQGQVSHFSLSSAERIEVLRGPFSALYGNASGGVIQIFTEDAAAAPTGSFSVAFGPERTWRAGARVSGRAGAVGVIADASEFHTSGFRPQSSATKTQGQVKLAGSIGGTRVTFIGNSVKILAEDALGLTRAEFDENPDQTTASALQFNTRKTTRQDQAGLRLDHAITPSLRADAVVYAGNRDVTQWQSIPVATQTAATQPGGVIAFSRAYWGTDVKLAMQQNWGNVVVGAQFDTLDEERKGYENFIGTRLGVTGNLRRDEDNNVQNRDLYLQSQFVITPRLKLTAGVRRSDVRFTSEDKYIIANRNPDDSGRASYRKTTPVVGASFEINKGFNIYASAGRGFETPTFNELSYRAGGLSGLNFALKPAVSDSVEIGAKWRSEPLRATASLFNTSTRDEIVTLTNSGGRSTFQNAGKTARRGAEMSFGVSPAHAIDVSAALTLLDARYDEAFNTCIAAPCTAPTVRVASGNKLPGVPRASAFVEAKWTSSQGFSAALELKHQARMFVNDVNSDAASAYTIANLRAGYSVQRGGARFTFGARIDNLVDKRYAGTVIVNEGNGRFFEPAPGRNWLLTANVQTTF
jgi:iron complex outermembrane recepter protein